jgi:choline dehydrogenase
MANRKVASHFDNGYQTDFAERVRLNQQKLTAELKPHYDFIVCGSGAPGSVVRVDWRRILT